MVFAVLFSYVSPAVADVKTVDFAADYADFALNPDTGTFAAIDPDRNEVAFFRNIASSAEGVVEPSTTAKSGKAPVSICFKRFEGKTVFVVGCSEDSHLYLYQAGGVSPSDQDFTLLKKVALQATGVSSIIASQNADDPFLYYFYGAGHDSAVGVFSLRDETDHGRLLGDAMDGAVSAGGEIFYTRGPWSPSGFKSFQIQNSLADRKPEFSPLFSEHESRGSYFPDPFGRMTIAGNVAYDETLSRRLGELPFEGVVFIQNPPLILGLSQTSQEIARQRMSRSFSPNSSPSLPKKIEYSIHAASYGTLSASGVAVKVKGSELTSDRSLPRGVTGQADFKAVVRKQKLIADDREHVVLFADRNRLSIIPVEDFEAPDEPLLMATLEGPDVLKVNEPSVLKVVTSEPGVQVKFDVLPAGMKADGNQLTWTPTADDVGAVEIVVALEANELQKSLSFSRQVVYPSITLPFAPAGILAPAEPDTLVIWEGPNRIEPGQRMSANATPGKSSYGFAIVDLKSGKVISERKLLESPSQVIDLGEKLLLLPPGNTSAKCEILNKSTLERVKSLMTFGAVSTAGRFGDHLVVVTDTTIEVYETGEFRKLRMVSNHARSTAETVRLPITRDGLVMNHVLFDEQLKPILNQSSRSFPILVTRLSSTNGDFRTALVPDLLNQPIFGQSLRRTSFDSTITAQIEIPETGVKVTAESTRKSVPALSPFISKQVIQVVLKSNDAQDSVVPLIQRTKHVSSDADMLPAPLLATQGRKVWVAFEQQLFLHEPDAAKEAPEVAVRLQRCQAHLTLASGKLTELTHVVRGGKPPYEFTSGSSVDGLSIDSRTGTITLDNAVLQQTALNQLTGANGGVRTQSSDVPDSEAAAASLATELLGKKPAGKIVALPVFITVTDADLGSDTLKYLVLIEVPKDEIDKHVAAWEAEFKKAQQEGLAKRAEAAQREMLKEPRKTDSLESSASPAEIAELKEKVQSLEERVDLLSRQLNELLKKQKN